MNAKELRNAIAEICETHDSLYAKLVKPINQLLINVDASISEETANKILENLKLFHSGDKYITECHFEESQNFLKDGIELLQKGDLANGALQIYGAGLNTLLAMLQRYRDKKMFISTKILKKILASSWTP